MMKPENNKIRIILLTMLLILSTAFPLFMQSSLAAVPKLDQIRVALFIDARGTVPSVTLSAAEGLHIGVRKPSGIKPWFTHMTAAPIRGSIDQYMVLLTETPDFILASNLAQKADHITDQSYIIAQNKQGKTVYRVYVGQFSTMGQAELAKDYLAAEAFLQGYPLTVTGPLHWNAGTYASETEALQQLNLISQSGLHANLVYHENNQEQLVYSIWVGEGANPVQLNEIKNEAARVMPSLNLQPIDSNMAYLLKRNEVTAGNPGAIIPHYALNASGQKLWISSDISNPIQVKERYGRSYRGSIELSQHKGRLAVINELPFEQYLYSVVSSELGTAWPAEALKAQAVAARTFALKLGMKYSIAHVSDTTYEQAYKGASAEFAAAVSAVDTTNGEVIVDSKGNLIEAFYYSNAGGVTADASEIWGTPLDYIKSVPSPDHIAEQGKLMWNRVVLPDGTTGYVRSDFTLETNMRNDAGYAVLSGLGSGVNVRSAPYVDDTGNPSINKINNGDRLILIEQTVESNAFSWIRGPYSAEQLRNTINRISKNPISGELQTLEISKRGPSGRVIEMKANGEVLQVNSPDAYRTAMNGLLSTRFDVEETGRYTIEGAEGQRHFPENKAPLYVLDGNDALNSTTGAEKMSASEIFVMNSNAQTRLLTKELMFRFIGLGYGHGIGMSQWGARELADFVGYDYQQILKYYYQDVNIVKG
jgi:stage II sporulation protein D